MSDSPRRKLLKSIAIGSSVFVAGKSLPNSWKRPVVDSVILPAHATTSVPCSAPRDVSTLLATHSTGQEGARALLTWQYISQPRRADLLGHQTPP